MKKQLILFLLITSLFFACKSEEQKQYDELIQQSNNLVIKLSNKPFILLSLDEMYAVHDERSRILAKATRLREDAKIDDRPTVEQMQTLMANFDKLRTLIPQIK